MRKWSQTGSCHYTSPERTYTSIYWAYVDYELQIDSNRVYMQDSR